MKTTDFIFLFIILLFISPFLFIKDSSILFIEVTKNYPFLMAFAKFSVLATIGEVIGLRIKTKSYLHKEFGLFPRMIIWGFLGVGIAAAMNIFAVGTPVLLERIGFSGIIDAMKEPLSIKKIVGAFSISVAMNCIFGPLFMTFHKITDTHLDIKKGKMKALITPINFPVILSNLNWKIQWNFVFAKTIPFFWIPAHTITFLMPSYIQVLLAAIYGIILGVFLSIAAVLSKQ